MIACGKWFHMAGFIYMQQERYVLQIHGDWKKKKNLARGDGRDSNKWKRAILHRPLNQKVLTFSSRCGLDTKSEQKVGKEAKLPSFPLENTAKVSPIKQRRCNALGTESQGSKQARSSNTTSSSIRAGVALFNIHGSKNSRKISQLSRKDSEWWSHVPAPEREQWCLKNCDKNSKKTQNKFNAARWRIQINFAK